jgi:hypothetical protein
MGWNNGEVYIGESQYGFQQGNGMMTLANGDKYSKKSVNKEGFKGFF